MITMLTGQMIRIFLVMKISYYACFVLGNSIYIFYTNTLVIINSAHIYIVLTQMIFIHLQIAQMLFRGSKNRPNLLDLMSMKIIGMMRATIMMKTILTNRSILTRFMMKDLIRMKILD
jgi:hypothetical protein